MHQYHKSFYWVQTIDGCEDWFVISPDEYLAEKFFAKFEGYPIDEVRASFICTAIFEDENDESYFPSFEMFKKNEFVIISEDEPMTVWKDGRKFCQGDIIHNINMQLNLESLGLYVVAIRNTDIFKIGITKNIVKRLKQFETANPFEFYLHEFFQTDKCRELEKLLHVQFKKSRYKREWFKLTEDELKQVCNTARNFIGLSNYIEGCVSPLSKIKLGQTYNGIKDNTNFPF